MFGRKRREVAQSLTILAARMVSAALNNTELEISQPGAGGVLFSATLFLVTGFLNKSKIALEMVPIYQRMLSESGIDREGIRLLSERLQSSYSEIRNAMIEAQEASNNNTNFLFLALADEVCTLADIKKSPSKNDILQDYFLSFLSQAKSLI